MFGLPTAATIMSALKHFSFKFFFLMKTDKKNQPKYFKGSYKILLGFLIAFSLLVLIKYLTQK